MPLRFDLKSPPGSAYAALTLMAFFLACNHIIGRAVHTEIPPIGLSFWRWMVGATILLCVLAIRARLPWRTLAANWRVFSQLGFFMIGSTTLVLIALNMTSAINVSLINTLQPTLTVLFSWLLLGEKLAGRRILGIFLGITGVTIMVSRGDLDLLLKLDFQAGDLLAVLAMCGFSGYALSLKRLPEGVTGMTALFGITLFGTAMLLPFYLYESTSIRAVPFTLSSVGAILVLALLVSIFGNLLWNHGNRTIGPARASIFINLIPVFGIFLAITFLEEQLLLFHLAGGVMVALGLYLVASTGAAGRS